MLRYNIIYYAGHNEYRRYRTEWYRPTRGNCGNDMMMIFGELSDDERLPVVYNTTR